MPNISEYFYSIQGEGPYVGHPSYFIRLSGGCLLRCPFCDSKFSWNADFGEPLSTIIDKLKIDPVCHNVILTGGEPLSFYKDREYIEFIEKLAPLKTIMFETTMIIDIELFFNQNMSEVLENVNNILTKNLHHINYFKYIISPKINKSCYIEKTNNYDIINYYCLKNIMPKEWMFNNIFYKLIYDESDKYNIKDFIDNCIPHWLRKNTFMMPITPLKFNKKEYILNCEKTIEFCKEEGLRYSPRVHIDVYGLRKGV